MGGLLSMFFSSASKYDIDKINIGDSKDTVRALFGQPEGVRQGLNENWTYTIPFRVYVSIDFDGDGKVTRKYRSGEPAKPV